MNPQETSSVSAKIGKFKASRMIVAQSWAVLMKDKEVMYFPFLSFIASLIALVGFIAVFFFIVMKGNINAFENTGEMTNNIITYASMFVYYLIMYLITNYFLAGVYTIVYARLNGQDLSFKDGINGANKNFSKIFIWSLISATVGVILNVIASKSRLGRVIATIIGAAWNILTYFSFPALIIGQKSVKESFKESASMIRKTWGETIIVSFSVSLFFAILVFLGLALAIGIMVLIPLTETFIVVTILLFIYLIVLTIVASTLSTIFKVVLYEYAQNGKIAPGFSPEIVQGAIKAK